MTTSPPRIHHLALPDGRIAYTVDGPADGPLVVLVPGMGDTRGTWRDLVGPLVEAGHRVAALDLRGHGDSDTTFGTHGDVVTSQDVIALVEHLHGPAVLVGSSMGAGSAALAAADRPDLVAGLVLFGPFLRDPAASAARKAANRLLYRVAFVRPWGAGFWASFYRKTLSRGRTGPWLDEHVEDLRALLSDPARLRSLRDLSLQLTHAPVEARVTAVVAPALAFVGAIDPDFTDPAAEADWIAGAVGADTVLLPEVAHYPQHQAPDVVVPRTLAWLTALPRTEHGAFVAATARAVR